jgi:hypothetical protein
MDRLYESLTKQLLIAVTNPSPDPSHHNQIQIQYWMPNSFCNMYMQTHTLGGIQRKGMCGVKTRASCLLGPKLIVS